MPPITPSAHVAKLNANLARTQKALDKALATWNRTGSEAAIREAKALSEHRNIIRQGIKGLGGALLSPAGLAEGVVGATVKAMRDSGVPMTPEEAIRQGKMKAGKGGPGKPRRTGERA